jgi:hypothetical protein
MTRIRPTFWLCWLPALLMVCGVHAQNVPRIGYVYPSGGRQGSSVQILLGGQFLDGATNVVFSGSGVRGTVLEHVKPITQKELVLYRDQLKELEAKKKEAGTSGKWTADDDRKIEWLRKKLANPPNRANPAISETVTIHVQIDPGAELGNRDIRLVTAQGLTNPRLFQIGQLPEFSRDAAASLRQRDPQKRVANRDRIEAFEQRVDLPTLVNGQILPGSEDRYRFFMRKGAHLVVCVSARELIPYLPDAVPGWFQASITLTDAKGRELTYADHYSFHPDPVLHFEIPENGDYCLSIRDSIYRGREDFVYRVALGELPFATGVYPRGGRAGTSIPMELFGWNLPVTNLVLDATALKPGVHFHSVSKNDLVSNPFPFDVDELPESVAGLENKGVSDSPVDVSIPVILNGRIGRSGAWNAYHFKGKAGEEIVAEVMARRLESPMDSVLRVTNAKGELLAFNDDFEDKGSGLNTHHADSRLSLKLPADGDYCVSIGDAQKGFGRDYGYRLRLSHPRPDFELRVVPSSLDSRPGTCVPLTVYALRKDGFTNDIEVVLKNAPKGFVLSGGWIPAGTEKARMTLSSPGGALSAPARLELEGSSIIGDRRVTHDAVPAEDMMQAFIYRHLVPSRELLLCSVGVGGKPLPGVSNSVVKLSPGRDTIVHLGIPPRMLEKGTIDLSEPLDGMSVKEVRPNRGGADVVLACDASKTKLGTKGNLLFLYFPDKATSKRPNQRPTGRLLPAVCFEIVTP